jgi:hypothetical protein
LAFSLHDAAAGVLTPKTSWRRRCRPPVGVVLTREEVVKRERENERREISDFPSHYNPFAWRVSMCDIFGFLRVTNGLSVSYLVITPSVPKYLHPLTFTNHI